MSEESTLYQPPQTPDLAKKSEDTQARLLEIFNQLAEQLGLDDQEKKLFLADIPTMARPEGYQGVFKIKIPKLDQAKIRITISPSKELMQDRLDRNVFSGVKIISVIKELSADPQLLRLINVEILTADYFSKVDKILGTHEIVLKENDGKVIAIDNKKALHYAQVLEEDLIMAQEGSSFAVEKLKNSADRISLDNESQYDDNTLLVDKEYRRGFGIGTTLFKTGIALATLLGAQERVVWTATPEGTPFYAQKMGADVKPYQFNGQTKEVPVLALN